MSSFDIAEGRILTALFIAHHGERRELLTWEDLQAHYHTKVSKMQFEAIVAELSSAGIVKLFRDKDGSGVILLDQGVPFAHDRILKWLGATTFDVNWKTERVVTDAEGSVDIPCPEGWMLIQVGKDEDSAAENAQPPRAAATKRDVAGADMMKQILQPASESWWVKWQTVLTAIGVVVAIVALFVTLK